MELRGKIWIDGKIFDFDDGKIHILAHALHYGTACFEGIHSYEAKKGVGIFRLKEHISRLYESAKVLGMQLRYSQGEIKKTIKKLIKINKIKDGYIRPLAFYGFGSLDVYPKNIKPSIAIIALPCSSEIKKPMRLMTSSYKRINPDASKFGAKISGFYANSVMAMREARQKGYDEALMLDSSGFVAEGPSHNVFMVKNGRIITSDSKSILPGITRLSLMELGRDLGYNVSEQKIYLDEIKTADEVFYCGTLSETIPIVQIDNAKIGNAKIGKITGILRKEFQKIVRGENKKYKKWLEYV
ncbi:branched-chain amino acid transaminase [Candidatus Woesearchaeota archaeon]|nr:branched-chain amino acid transaminase [Candidatus Woesearchaeota archaeon]